MSDAESKRSLTQPERFICHECGGVGGHTPLCSDYVLPPTPSASPPRCEECTRSIEDPMGLYVCREHGGHVEKGYGGMHRAVGPWRNEPRAAHADLSALREPRMGQAYLCGDVSPGFSGEWDYVCTGPRGHTGIHTRMPVRRTEQPKTSEGRRAPVVTNDEAKSGARPARQEEAVDELVTPSSRPGASEEAGVLHTTTGQTLHECTPPPVATAIGNWYECKVCRRTLQIIHGEWKVVAVPITPIAVPCTSDANPSRVIHCRTTANIRNTAFEDAALLVEQMATRAEADDSWNGEQCHEIADAIRALRTGGVP